MAILSFLTVIAVWVLVVAVVSLLVVSVTIDLGLLAAAVRVSQGWSAMTGTVVVRGSVLFLANSAVLSWALSEEYALSSGAAHISSVPLFQAVDTSL